MQSQLLPCLSAQTWRMLRAIARGLGLPFDSNWSRAEAAERLHTYLLGIHALQAQWRALSPEGRFCWTALWQEGGAIRRDAFRRRFGSARPYGLWPVDAPDAAWHAPQSPAEELLYRGLAFQVNQGTAERPVWAVVLPDEYAPVVAGLAAPAAPQDDAPPARPPFPIPTVAGDLFVLLSLLNRHDVRPIWERYLPPTLLRELGRCLRPPLDLQAVRSERGAPYVAFLHYLAERAGLVETAGGLLKPTLIAHEWLAAPLRQRLSTLWQAWIQEEKPEPRSGQDTLWALFHLPGYEIDDMPERFRGLLAHLARHPLDQPFGTEAYLDALLAARPPLFRWRAYDHWQALDREEQRQYREQVRRALGALLDGPLTWFGVLAPVDEGRARRLAPLGVALLGREAGVWPGDPPPAPLRLSPRLAETDAGPSIEGQVPPGLPLPHRFALEALAVPDAQEMWRVSKYVCLAALQRGQTVEGLIRLLERAAQEPLPPELLGALYRWAEAHEQLAVRQVVLLEAREAALLTELTRSRRIRETLGQTFSLRAVQVHADRLPALLRRLAARGYAPRLELSDPALVSPARQRPSGRGGALSDEALIAVALRIYAALGDELDLPGGPAHGLARDWADKLSLPERDAVERAAQRALDRLRRAAPPAADGPEGDYRLPVPTGPLLLKLDQAIAQGGTVEIDYYTAGRDHATTRRVDPLRIEWHGPVVYLVAHCHLRGAQRVFRVDRIAALRAESDDDGGR